MIINVTTKNGTVKINQDFASQVPEFGAVLEDPELGEKYLAFVIYLVDSGEDNLYSALPEEVRRDEIIGSLELQPSKTKSKKVSAAIKKYKVFNDSNVQYQFKAAYEKGMKKLSSFVSSADVDEKNSKDFASVLFDMPKIMAGATEIQKLGAGMPKKVFTKAGKTLTEREQRDAN